MENKSSPAASAGVAVELIEKLRFKNPESLAGMLINGRNAAQLFVSADRRYGPTYNIGTAREVFEALLRNGYPFDSGKPVTLVGFSGGAQISIGAASYLGMSDIPIRVVSIGGMMSDDPGLNRVEQVWHLRGTKDIFEKLGGVMFAGRWPHAAFSPGATRWPRVASPSTTSARSTTTPKPTTSTPTPSPNRTVAASCRSPSTPWSPSSPISR